MTTPTLALGISAAGAQEVANLAASVASLRSNLQQLAQTSTGGTVANLDALAREFKEMRRELNETLQGLRTDLAGHFKQAFDAAAKQAKTGGEQVEKEMEKAAARVRVAAKGIDIGGNLTASVSGSGISTKEAVAKMASELQALPSAVEATGLQTARAFAKNGEQMKALWVEHLIALRERLDSEKTMMDQAVARFREIREAELQAQMQFEGKQKALWLQHRADLAERLAQEATAMDAAVLKFKEIQADRLQDQIIFEQKQKSLWFEHQAALKERLALEATAMDSAVLKFRELQAEQLADQIAFEDKQKGRWYQHLADLKVRLEAEKTMMDQAVREFRARQAETFNTTIRRSVGQAMSTPSSGLSLEGAAAAGTFSSLQSGELRNLPKVLEDVNKKTPVAAAHMASLSKEMSTAHSAARGLASGFGAIWLTWGQLAPLLAGAALSNAFVQTVKMGAEVQEQLSTIRVLSEESTVSVQKLNDQMLAMARTGPFGPLEIAKAMKTLSLAGLDASEVAASINDVLHFAVAGTTSIEKAADVLTTVGTAFKISANDYNYIGDVIAKTAAVSKASVESVGAAFKTASVINSQYGASLKDVGLGIAILSNVGIQTSAAGTALRNFYVDILGRTPKVQKSLEAIGLSADFAFDKATGKARGFVNILTDLTEALKKKDAIGQTRATQDEFSERGGKVALEAISLLQSKLKATKGDFANDLLYMQNQIEQSAGFMSISFAEMSLTASNQMKSTVSALQASMVKSFDALQPYILDTAQKLKDAFNSDEFQSSLQKLVVLIGDLTLTLVTHADTLLKVGVAWLGLKVVSLVAALIETANVKIIAGTAALFGNATAANFAASANTALAASYARKAEADAAAAAAATVSNAAAATFVSRLGSIVSVGVKFLSWAGLAYGAWELYSYWTDKADEATKKKVDHSGALLEALRSEADRLHDINQARILGISLEELALRKRVEAQRQANSDSASTAGSAKLAEAQRMENLAATGPESLKERRLRSAQSLREQAALEQSAASSDARFMNKALEREQARVRQEADIQAKAVEASMRARQIRPTGGSPYELPGRDQGGHGPGRDNTLSTLDSEMRSRESVLKNAYDNEMKLLEAKHQGELISEGTYQAQVLQRTEAFESASLALLKKAQQDEKAAYEKRKADIEGDAKLAKNPEGRTQALENLKNDYDRYSQQVQASIDKVTSGALERQQLSVIKLDSEVHKLTKSNDDYWKKAVANGNKEAALAETRRNSVNLSEAERVSLEARTKVMESHTVELEKVQDEYSKAVTALDTFTSEMKGDTFWSQEALAKYDALRAAVEALRKAAEKGRTTVDQLADQAANTAVKDLQAKKIDDFGKQIADGLTDAILSGGKEGGKKLKDWLKNLFIREPLKVLIQTVLKGPVSQLAASVFGGAVNGAAGGAAGGGLGSVLGGGLASMAGSVGTAFTAGSTSVGVMAGSVAGGGGMMGGLAAAAGAIPVAGWVALGAMAAYSIFGGKGGGPKTESGFGYGVPLRGDPAAAKGVVDGVKQQLAGIKELRDLQLGVFTAADPKGTAKTQLAVEASLNGKSLYSRAARTGGIENVGRSEAELAAAITEETNRVVMHAFQAINLPDKIGEYVRSLGDTDKMGVDALVESVERIKKAMTERATLDDRLYRLEHNEAEILAHDRANELDALDETNRALLSRIHYLEDEKKAAEVLQDALSKAKDSAKAFSEFMAGVNSNLRTYLDKLNGTPAGGLPPEAQLANARSQFDQQIALAKAGDRNALQGITGYADQLISAQTAVSASSAPTANTIAAVRAALSSLPGFETTEQFLARTIKEGAADQVDATKASGDKIWDGLWGSAGLLSQQFEKLDTNLNGKLDFSELKDALGPLATDETIRQFMTQADTNGDGQIDKLEAVRKSVIETGLMEAQTTVKALGTSTLAPKAEVPSTSNGGPVLDSWRQFLLNSGAFDTATANALANGQAPNLQFQPLATGGIMTPYGKLALNAYAGGGVVDSPQMYVAGEGGMNEAIVPLPNGTHIPVEIRGGGSDSKVAAKLDRVISLLENLTVVDAAGANAVVSAVRDVADNTAGLGRQARRESTKAPVGL